MISRVKEFNIVNGCFKTTSVEEQRKHNKTWHGCHVFITTFFCILSLYVFSVTIKQITEIRARKTNYNATYKTNYSISLDLHNVR